MLTIALAVSACGRVEDEQADAALGDERIVNASLVNNDTSPTQPPKQLIILNIGDLKYVDKLLMQRSSLGGALPSRATEAHKKEAATWLAKSQRMAAEDKASDFQHGYSGISKMHCPSAMTYPTNEALLICAESEVLSDIASIERVNRFRGASRMYHAVLKFSNAVGEPLSSRQRQSVKANISCLDAFLAKANMPAPTCELIFTTLR